MSTFAGFQSVKLDRPKQSMFDLTHDKRVSTRMGRLTPVLCMECVPSDSVRGSSEMLVRLAPLLAPIYDQINVFVHFFFVPNRLLWEDWEEFITGGRLGVGIDPLLAPVPPFIDIGDVLVADNLIFVKSALADYLGAPIFLDIDPTPANWVGREMDLMPFAAYQLCWYEYYRDRNFVSDSVFGFPISSGEATPVQAAGFLVNRTRCYTHDYFTSALPFTQRGETVMLPLAFETSDINYRNPARLYGPDGVTPLAGGGVLSAVAIVGGGTTMATATDSLGTIDNIDSISADASNISINDFRAAYALQVWLERNAIGGSRYTESTQAHFGVKPQDSRLQRPEYIGGGRIPVKISEVLSTSWSNDGIGNVPLANMGGHGVTYGNTNQFRYYCTEHGFVMGIVSIMNPPSYQQGLPRMFRRRSFLDYPWPTFAKLGEQEVADFEIYCDPAALLEDAETGQFPSFGYQSRYADWKYVCNSNHGEFRDTLLFWTLTRTFGAAPVLSQAFNEFADDTQDRIFAVPGGDNFWLYVHNNVHVKRPLPYFGTPNTLGF